MADKRVRNIEQSLAAWSAKVVGLGGECEHAQPAMFSRFRRMYDEYNNRKEFDPEQKAQFTAMVTRLRNYVFEIADVLIYTAHPTPQTTRCMGCSISMTTLTVTVTLEVLTAIIVGESGSCVPIFAWYPKCDTRSAAPGVPRLLTFRISDGNSRQNKPTIWTTKSNVEHGFVD